MCGRKRPIIGSPEFEQKLLENDVLQAMAPMSIKRRVDYIKQKYKVDCTFWQLKKLYKIHNVTFRVSSKSWKIDEEERARLNE